MSLRLRAISLILLISLLLSLCPAALAEEILTITSDTRVYVEPDTDSDYYSVKKGWEVVLLAYGKGEYSDWARIANSYTGKVFYIKTKYLSKSDTESSEKDTESTSAYVLVDGLSIYKEKSLSSDRVRSLTRGRQVTVHSESNGWAKIEYSGKQGYVPSAALSDEKPASTQRMYTTKATCAYLKASSSSAEIESFKAGEEVTVYAAEGDWYVVSAAGAAGYIRKSHLQENKTSSAYVLVDGLSIYKEESLSSSRVRSLTRGRTVTVHSESNGWAKIEYSGKQGYVPSAALCDEKPSSKQRMYAAKATTVYLKASSSSAEIASIKAGEEVTVYATEGSWSIVSISGGAGYVSTSHLSENKISASGYESIRKTAYVKNDSAKVYTADNTDSTVAFRLGYGTELSVRGLSADGKWAKIRYNSKDYYMQCSALSSSPVENDIILADWFESSINSSFKKGTRATITDVDSGLTWTVVRRGSTNHADVEPVSDADTATMRQAVADSDGEWNYTRHAVIVTINGKRYAASIYTEPHGNASVNANDYSGHFCIHFLNSRTHGTDRVDEGHQKMVMKAYNAF